jgi:hypothetical protein
MREDAAMMPDQIEYKSLIKATMRNGVLYWVRQHGDGYLSFCKNKYYATRFVFDAVDRAVRRFRSDFPSEISYEIIVAPVPFQVNAA